MYSTETFYQTLVNNFNAHYTGNRAPYGIWLHPAFLMGDPTRVEDLNRFISYANAQQDVHFVTVTEALAWMQDPVKAASYAPASCLPVQPCSVLCTTEMNSCHDQYLLIYVWQRTLQVSETLCDGLDDNGNGLIDEGLVTLCAYPSGTFHVCGACPTTIPTFSQPFPAKSTVPVQTTREAFQCLSPPTAETNPVTQGPFPYSTYCGAGGFWNAATCTVLTRHVHRCICFRLFSSCPVSVDIFFLS